MPTLRLAGQAAPTTGSAFVHSLPVEARSWADVAELAYLEAVVAAAEIEAYEQRIVACEHRLQDAAVWFSSREPSHSHWDAALERRAVIDREQRGCEATLPCLALRCWTACCDLYVAVHMGMTKDERYWWIANSDFSGLTRSPGHIWAAVAGERSAPGSWPTQDRDYWVVQRPRAVELWHLPEMRELLRKVAA